MKKTDLAWVAGFFEGEGNVWGGIYKRRNQSGIGWRWKRGIHMSMCQAGSNGRLVLNKVLDILGVGKIFLSQKAYVTKDGKKRKLIYKLQISAYDDIIRVWKLIRPWLSPRRQMQFQKALAKYNSFLVKQPGSGNPKRQRRK